MSIDQAGCRGRLTEEELTVDEEFCALGDLS